MNEHRRRREAPLPEEYSRVSDPERFRPLHARALALVERLAAEFVVVRSEAFTLPPDISSFPPHAQPPVTLTPGAADAGDPQAVRIDVSRPGPGGRTVLVCGR